MTESLRDKSRRDWLNDTNSNESIQLGCMLRIADATEKMAIQYSQLIDQRDMYKRWNENAQKNNDLLKRQLAASKGQITKLRKKLTQVSAPKEGSHE